MFRKNQYQEAQKFLEENEAKIIKVLNFDTSLTTLYELKNGEQWEEFESKLESPEDDYTLQKVIK